MAKQEERKLVKGIIIALAFFFLIGFLLSLDKYRDGYYHYGNAHYYNSNDNWYYYDDTSEYWFPASSVPDGLKQNADKYFYSEYYDYKPDTGFQDTDYSSDWEDSRSHSDSSDSSWDYSDWDSGYTDWDSDW